MDFLQGLHGTIAVVLISSLLFVDEAGLPMPVAPNEAMLLIAGVLIGSGQLPLWVFLPVAFLAMLAGMITGYGWARAAGQTALRALARHIGAGAALERLSAKVRSAGPVQIGVLRLLPGVRPHATLVSGAAEVPARTFLTGAVPALVVWLVVWTVLGQLVGLPVEHSMHRFEKLALRGALLAAVGVGGFLGVRRLTAEGGGSLQHLPQRVRLALALVLDSSLVAAVVAGLLAVGRRLLHLHGNGWADLVVVLAFIAGALVLTRAGGGETLGERLFACRYPGPGASRTVAVR
jgi:membrane protein DedA with SNARE-associated domain